MTSPRLLLLRRRRSVVVPFATLQTAIGEDGSGNVLANVFSATTYNAGTGVMSDRRGGVFTDTATSANASAVAPPLVGNLARFNGTTHRLATTGLYDLTQFWSVVVIGTFNGAGVVAQLSTPAAAYSVELTNKLNAARTFGKDGMLLATQNITTTDPGPQNGPGLRHQGPRVRAASITGGSASSIRFRSMPGVEITTVAGAPTGTAALYIGGSQAGNFNADDIYEVHVIKGVLSAAQALAYQRYARDAFGAVTGKVKQLQIHGDSIANHIDSITPEQCLFPLLALEPEFSAFDDVNCGRGGKGINDINTSFTTDVMDVLHTDVTQATILLHIGTNDLALSSRSIAQVKTDITTWITARRAELVGAGITPTFVLDHLIMRATGGTSSPANIKALNASLNSGTGADIVVPWDDQSTHSASPDSLAPDLMSDVLPTETTGGNPPVQISQDGIHPSTVGYGLMKKHIKRAMGNYSWTPANDVEQFAADIGDDGFGYRLRGIWLPKRMSLTSGAAITFLDDYRGFLTGGYGARLAPSGTAPIYDGSDIVFVGTGLIASPNRARFNLGKTSQVTTVWLVCDTVTTTGTQYLAGVRKNDGTNTWIAATVETANMQMRDAAVGLLSSGVAASSTRRLVIIEWDNTTFQGSIEVYGHAKQTGVVRAAATSLVQSVAFGGVWTANYGTFKMQACGIVGGAMNASDRTTLFNFLNAAPNSLSVVAAP